MGPLSMAICPWNRPLFAIQTTSSANPPSGPLGPHGLSSSNLRHSRIASSSAITRSPRVCRSCALSSSFASVADWPVELETAYHSPRIDPYHICDPPQKNYLVGSMGTAPNSTFRHRIRGSGYPVGSPRGCMMMFYRTISADRGPPAAIR